MMCRGGVLREAPEAGVVDRPDRCQPKTQFPSLGRVTGVLVSQNWLFSDSFLPRTMSAY